MKRDASAAALQDQFGSIDIYLFDQLLRGRLTPGMRVVAHTRPGGVLLDPLKTTVVQDKRCMTTRVARPV